MIKKLDLVLLLALMGCLLALADVVKSEPKADGQFEFVRPKKNEASSNETQQANLLERADEPVRLNLEESTASIIYPLLEAQLLAFSDHPEKVDRRGLLFRGGLIPFKPVRFQYYHQGGRVDNDLWLRLELKNLGTKKAVVQLIEGKGGPDSDYFQAGHVNNLQFLSRVAHGESRNLMLEPGESLTLFCQNMPYDEVLSGSAQFTLYEGSNVGFSLLSLQDPEESPSFNLLTKASDVHARGIYACTDQFVNRIFNLPEDKDVQVAIGAVRQPNVYQEPELKGDYGVIYAMRFLVNNNSEEDKTVHVIANPRGGKATVTALLQTEVLEESPPPFTWLNAQVPALESFRNGGAWQDCSLHRESEAFQENVIGQFCAPAQKSTLVRLLTIPEGASNYPVRFILRAK